MSSGITEKDSLFVAFTPAWHGLGTVVKEALSSEDALRIAGLNWNVEQQPIYLKSGKLVDGVFANVRSDIDESLGMVTGKYKILQNVDAFSFVDSIIEQDDIPCKYESAGSLFGGQRVWMMARMPDKKILDDDVATHLFISNSHDGKSSVKIGLTSTRIVCSNTLQIAIKSAPRVWTARHMSSIEGKQREAMETLQFASRHIDALSLKAEEYSQIRTDISVFLDKLFVVNEKTTPRVLRNIEHSREEVLRIHNTKNDLGNFRNTSWGIYNAVADFVSNSEPLRKTDTFETRRFVSYMDGNATLERAQAILETA